MPNDFLGHISCCCYIINYFDTTTAMNRDARAVMHAGIAN